MDNVLQIEVLLNMLNTIFAKAVCFEDTASINELHNLRHNIYYNEFDYDEYINKLKKIDIDLNKYE